MSFSGLNMIVLEEQPNVTIQIKKYRASCGLIKGLWITNAKLKISASIHSVLAIADLFQR
jgi:hypothetical protein